MIRNIHWRTYRHLVIVKLCVAKINGVKDQI